MFTSLGLGGRRLRTGVALPSGVGPTPNNVVSADYVVIKPRMRDFSKFLGSLLGFGISHVLAERFLSKLKRLAAFTNVTNPIRSHFRLAWYALVSVEL